MSELCCPVLPAGPLLLPLLMLPAALLVLASATLEGLLCLAAGVVFPGLAAALCHNAGRLGSGSGSVRSSTKARRRGGITMWNGSPVNQPTAKKAYAACKQATHNSYGTGACRYGKVQTCLQHLMPQQKGQCSARKLSSTS